MSDNLPIVLSIAAGALYALGIAANSALLHFSHSKLERLLQDEERHQSVVQHLRNFDGIVFSLALFNAAMVTLFVGCLVAWRHPAGLDTLTTTLGTGLLISVIVVSGVIHATVRHRAETFLLWLLGFCLVIHRVMAFVRVPIATITRFAAGAPLRSETDEAVEDILDAVAEGEAGGNIEEGAADFIENIMEFKDRTVREVMTPRTSMICTSSDKSFDEVMALVQEHGHSKIPLYGENRDDIVGLVFLKDLVRRRKEEPKPSLEAIARKAFFVPETKMVHELLKEFQQQKTQIAIVIDEFGGTSGLVTVEDIVEEIVGELEDEFDISGSPDIDRLGDRDFEIDAKLEIEELNEMLELKLPEDGDYETVGGFLSAELGKVPEAGDQFAHSGVNFEVTEADERRVKRIRVTMTHPVEG